MNEQRPSMKEPGFWVFILRYILMWTMAIVAVVGFSRFLNAVLRRGVLFELDFPSYLPTYLIASGLVLLAVGMVAYIAAKEKRSWHILAFWVGALLTIGITWLERLVLWSPDQGSTNNVFTIILHLVWLFLISLYSFLSQREGAVDGPGN